MASSLHLVDAELRPLLDAFPTVSLSDDNLAELRARDLPFTTPDNDGVLLEELTLPGPANAPDVAARLYRPAGTTGPVGCIFHIHGGGYVGGSAREFEFLHRPMVSDLGCAIISVDYRIAPETRFPGAIEDCYAALSWTFQQADSLELDPARIGVMGESAGGGYAASLALMARDRGEYLIAFQHLIYPMIDDRTCGRAENPYAGEFIWTRHNNHFGWSALLGHEPGQGDVSPYAAASRAEDLAGLPPTFIGTAALDLFVDENIDFATRLIRAGVPTELHVWPGGFHGFDMMPGPAIAEAARNASREALRRALQRKAD